MAKRQVRDFNKAIFRRTDIEVDVAEPAQPVVFLEARKRHDRTAAAARRSHAVDDVGRVPGTADCDQEVAGTGVEFDLLGEDILVAEIVAEAGQGGGVAECEGSQPAVLREVDSEVARNTLAPAIADEYQLVAAIVRLVRQTAEDLEATLQANVLARQVGHRSIADGRREGVEIRNYSLPHGYLLPQQFTSAAR